MQGSAPVAKSGGVCLLKTHKFSVLSSSSSAETHQQHGVIVDTDCEYPTLSLEDLLLHEPRHVTRLVSEQLWQALQTHGFLLLTTPSTSRPAAVLDDLRRHLHQYVFPVTNNDNNTPNAAGLGTSDTIYLSERNVPMYRLGYELCKDDDDGYCVREVFRIAAGDPDETPWLWVHNSDQNDDNNSKKGHATRVASSTGVDAMHIRCRTRSHSESPPRPIRQEYNNNTTNRSQSSSPAAAATQATLFESPDVDSKGTTLPSIPSYPNATATTRSCMPCTTLTTTTAVSWMAMIVPAWPSRPTWIPVCW